MSEPDKKEFDRAEFAEKLRQSEYLPIPCPWCGAEYNKAVHAYLHSSDCNRLRADPEGRRIVAIAATNGVVYALDAAGRLWASDAGKWVPISTPQTDETTP